MKKFHLSLYQLHNEKKLRIFIVSDIHFSYQVTDGKLESLILFAKKNHPDYIFIPGDLIDSSDMIKESNEEKRLLKFLEKLGRISKVLISVGNHDSYLKSKDNWKTFQNTAFHKKIRALENVWFLDNESYEDEKIFVFGFTQTPEYYNFGSQAEKKHFGISRELKDVMLRDLNKQNFKNLPKNKLCFLLVHSPVWLNDPVILEKLKSFDYFISGHMHNGVVPPILDELIPGTRGIISPTRNPFPKGIRYTLKKETDKSVVVGAFTTFHECVGILNRLNAFFPSYAAILDFSPENPKKPKLVKKYFSFSKNA